MNLEELSGKSQEDVLNVVLDALVTEGGTRKALTHHTLKLIKAAKPVVGEANTLLLEGILRHQFVSGSSRFFLEAEAKGCTHPLLYHYLGCCYYEEIDIPSDDDKANYYFTKLIQCKTFR